jgi:hypothetical protein
MMFQQTFGFAAEFPQGIIQTRGGDYYIFGTSSLPGLSFYRVTPSGNIVWSKKESIGNPYCSYMLGHELDTGSFELFLQENLNAWTGGCRMVGMDTTGNVFGSGIFDFGMYTHPACIAAEGDTGFLLVAGNDQNPFHILGLSAYGSPIWSRTYYMPAQKLAPKMITATHEGGFAVTGINTGRMFIMRADSSHHAIWSKFYSLPAGAITPYDIIETMDHGLVTCGTAYPSKQFMMKTDSSGNMLWQFDFHDRNLGHALQKVKEKANGNLIVLGASDEGQSFIDIRLMELNSSGQILWQRFYGGNAQDSPFDFCISQDGGYVIAAYTIMNQAVIEQPVYLLKTDSVGATTCFDSTMSYPQQPFIISDSAIAISDSNATYNIQNAPFAFSDTVSVVQQYCSYWTNIDLEKLFPEAAVYPNPSQGQFTIRFDEFVSGNKIIELCDLNGSIVLKTESASQTCKIKADCVPGFYILKIKISERVIYSRIVIY